MCLNPPNYYYYYAVYFELKILVHIEILKILPLTLNKYSLLR